MQSIMFILLRYVVTTPRYVIKSSSRLDDRYHIKNTLRKLINLIPVTDFMHNKLGGIEKIVRVDKKRINFECKSHHGLPK
ncbi:hypothetical protein H311_00043 [Anncaliia algerae PRA109]|nr:hypothetical protein H311_00043 [Anncaliia algerae PRA109]